MTELVLLGPLAPDSATRVARRLDEHIRFTARRGRSINVTGGRQTGKTTSLLDLRVSIVRDGGASAYVDLSPFGDAQQSAGDWLADFANATNRSMLPEETRTNAPPPPEDFAGLHDYFLRLASTVSPRRPLVLILDEVTGVPRRFQQAFFYSIRALINLQADPGKPAGIEDLLFVFGGSFDPDRLIKDSNNSPFNVSETIDTGSFEYDATETGTALDLAGCERPPELVLELTGGHPYLTNVVAMLPTGVPTTDISQVVIASRDLNIAYLSRNLRGNPELLRLACRIGAGETIDFLPALDERLSELVVIGLVGATEGGDCFLRGVIYQRLVEQLCTMATQRAEPAAGLGPLGFVPDPLRLNLEPLLASASATAFESPATATVCMGAVVEGSLLTLFELHSNEELRAIASQINTEVAAGRLNGSMRVSPATLPAAEWTLAQMIEGARLAKLVSATASQVSHGLRDWRNLIHPAKARVLFPTGVPTDIGQAAVANGAVLLREISAAAELINRAGGNTV